MQGAGCKLRGASGQRLEIEEKATSEHRNRERHARATEGRPKRMPSCSSSILFIRIRQRHCRFSIPIRPFSANNTDLSTSIIKETQKQRQIQSTDAHGYTHHTFSLSTIDFFVSPSRVSLSSLSVSLVIRRENYGWVGTFSDLGKGLLKDRRVQWRFRGTRTMLYTHWGSACQMKREHQHWERTPSGCCVWHSR